MTPSLFQEWVAAQCNGEWEHSAIIKITALDNPGWWMEVEHETDSLYPMDGKFGKEGEVSWEFTATKFIAAVEGSENLLLLLSVAGKVLSIHTKP